MTKPITHATESTRRYITSLQGIRNVPPNGVFGNEVYGSDSEGFGMNPLSNEFRLCNSDEWRSGNHSGRVIIRGYGGGGDMVLEKCAALFYMCAALGAISAIRPKIKVVENSFPDAWPPESHQTEFVCSSYGQNSRQVSGDLYLHYGSLLDVAALRNSSNDLLYGSYHDPMIPWHSLHHETQLMSHANEPWQVAAAVAAVQFYKG
ncbi:hypothetical protein Tco_0786182 [Tanacetum coccineum]